MDEPLIISSRNKAGGGIIVIKSKQTSFISHVIFNALSVPIEDKLSLSGAITFYESPVEINHAYFLNNILGDDYLNIIRSKFSIRNSVFKGIQFDALDLDYSQGSVSSTEFLQVGNDAIDLSGSHVSLNNLKIVGVGDKGISIGENSNVQVNNVWIEDATNAIVSKDASKLVADGINVKNSTRGLIIFQKKPEYGNAMMTVINYEYSETNSPYIVEKGSFLTLDGESMPALHTDVRGLLYPKKAP